MFSRGLVVAAILLALLAGTSHASSSTISPCRHVSQPTWSPDGQQIVYYGTRWPKPSHPHRNPNDILQAICTANADGTNPQPLRYTVCSENCLDPPSPFVWLQSGIVYLRSGDIFRIVPGSKPQKVAKAGAVNFVTNPTGTRIATQKYYPGCQLGCRAPVKILDAQTGAVVGKVGGNRFDSVNPSLSPDGSQVAFERDASGNPGKTYGIWAANTSGSHLHRVARLGEQPMWSPTSGTIAYVVFGGKSVPLRLVSAGGGKSRTLVRNVSTVFGWSPNGKSIAFETNTGKLAVVDVATRKVSTLRGLRNAQTAAWSPNSSELLANTVSAKCWSTWRVPADGSAATRISSCH